MGVANLAIQDIEPPNQPVITWYGRALSPKTSSFPATPIFFVEIL